LAELKRTQLSVKQEKALLVGAILRSKEQVARDSGGDPLAELESLAGTAGARIVGRVRQKLNRIDPAFYIGKGKAAEIGQKAQAARADTIIFDNDLSPAQIRDLEEVTGCKVLDRSELILDIFATRAQTHQARLAVELAQLEYTFPRLRAMWTHLDTVVGGATTAAAAVGGIGTRGPGETQIETDRRLVRKRIDFLRRKLGAIEKRRRREVKARAEKFTVSLVGYTNAGKSSLMNALTGSRAFVEDKLFATLDTKTRQWKLAPGRVALLSDTVGFVRDLPHHLIESFKATLEETTHADLLLHVVDVANPEALEQVETVNRVLGDLGVRLAGGDNDPDGNGDGRHNGKKNGDGDAGPQACILVLNKADSIEDLSILTVLQSRYPDAVVTSARSGRGLAKLTERVLDFFQGQARRVRITCPVADGKGIAYVESHAEEIHARHFDGERATLEATMAAKWLDRLAARNGGVTVEPLDEGDPS
jgi:GTP-binding protein HflX